MHPRSLEINWEFLEDVCRDKETLVFDMDKSSVHPHKIVRLKSVMLESLCHEEEFGEEDGVIHLESILNIILVELFFGEGQMMVDDFFHFGGVPLRLEPAYFLIDEDGVGPVTVLVHEDIHLIITKDDQVGIRLQHLRKELQIVFEAPLLVIDLGFHLAAFYIPQSCDDGDHGFVL
jgi:hypothetical protein